MQTTSSRSRRDPNVHTIIGLHARSLAPALAQHLNARIIDGRGIGARLLACNFEAGVPVVIILDMSDREREQHAISGRAGNVWRASNLKAVKCIHGRQHGETVQLNSMSQKA